jgi:hypothetical protein
MKLRKARITIQTDQVMIVRRQRLVRFWCDECGGEAEFVPLEGLNGLLQEGDQAKSRPVGSSLHLGRMRDGSVVVCIKSLSRTS